MLFGSTGLSGAELIQGSICAVLLNQKHWKLAGHLVLSVFCPTYTSCKSWCGFWLVSDLQCAIPCWLVVKLSVSPSLSETAGVLVVLMLLWISKHWIFSLLVSDFSDCFKSFLMSKGKFWVLFCFVLFFTKAWKIIALFLPVKFSCMHSSKKLMLKATCACCFVLCLGNLCNECKTKSYASGKSFLWHLQYQRHGYQIDNHQIESENN